MSDKPKTGDRFITVSEKYIKELEQKADVSEYFKGRVDGMEYVIDALENAFKGAGDEHDK